MVIGRDACKTAVTESRVALFSASSKGSRTSVAEIEGCAGAIVVSMAVQMVVGTEIQYLFVRVRVLYGCGVRSMSCEQWSV